MTGTVPRTAQNVADQLLSGQFWKIKRHLDKWKQIIIVQLLPIMLPLVVSCLFVWRMSGADGIRESGRWRKGRGERGIKGESSERRGDAERERQGEVGGC